MKKNKVGLYVLMCRDPQDILNANKKTQGIKQCIESDPLYVNFERLCTYSHSTYKQVQCFSWKYKKGKITGLFLERKI